MQKRQFAARKAKNKRTTPSQRLKRGKRPGDNEETARLKRELSEALEHQDATSEVLKAISRSTFDLQTVLDTLIKSAARLCAVDEGVIFLRDGDVLRMRASYGFSTEALEFARANPMKVNRGSATGRVALEGRPVHIEDVLADPEYSVTDYQRTFRYRTVLSVPLLREGSTIGVFALTSAAVKPFSDRQIRLARTFADQAAIAIENARLFNETKEALEQQTATASVLKVISRSAFDLHTVLQTLVESAARLCDADKALIYQRDGNLYRLAAAYGVSREFEDYTQHHPISPGRGTTASRAALEGRTIHIPDVLADPEYTGTDRQSRGNFRSTLGVPLLRVGETIGIFSLLRNDVRPYTEKQIELTTTFADQAIIAIENARLFDEVQAKTRDLEESLQQQTATADVLKVISRSAFDLQAVLNTLVQSAVTLSGGSLGTIYQKRGALFHMTAAHGYTPEMSEYGRANPLAPGPGSNVGRTAMTGTVVQIPDVLADADYTAHGYQRVGNFRAMLGVPIMRDAKVEGVFSLAKPEPGPFGQRQVELVQTFADQAVIAIENARLFDEVQAKTRDLQESLRQQTATADVLKVISRSAFNLDAVLGTLVESAARLCEAERGILFLRKGNECHVANVYGFSEELEAFARAHPIPIDGASSTARAAASGIAVQTVDLLADPGLGEVARQYQKLGGHRTNLGVPLNRDGETIGVFTLTRQVVRAFTDKQIELVQTFADQAVIAIENARLFNEVQAKTSDLEESLQQQTATAEVLQVINSSPGHLEPVFAAMLERATQLCEAAFGILWLCDGEQFRAGALHGVPAAYAEIARKPVTPLPSNPLGRMLRGERLIVSADVADEEAYRAGDPVRRALVDLAGARSVIQVPLLKDDLLLGSLTVYRQEVRPFSEKQITLLQNFAAQGVIAMENARLITETREALEQQTATGDVLKIISRSSIELRTVLDTLVETVARLCRADQALMYRLRDEEYHLVAEHGLPTEARQFGLAHPLVTGRGTAAGRAGLERRPVHIPDVSQDPEYAYAGPKLTGARTMLSIPLLREEGLVGIFTIQRTRVEPFTDKEIELVTTFADQAVIAIENARLFEELRERQAELRVTFDNMGDGVAMFGADKQLAAWNRNFQELLDLPDGLLVSRPSFAELFRYLAERGEFGSADLQEELRRSVEDTSREMRYERSRPDGRVVEVRRNPVPDGGFVLIYADITERKRAEEAIRLARDAAEKALRDLQTAQDRLIQTEKLASLGQLTAGIAHEIKNPLNFVNNFSALSVELADELNEVLQQVTIVDAVQKEVDELTALLKDNLGKVVQHGKRADSIVKNMLLHSREGSGEYRPTDVNALVEESLNLAYHGARAEKPQFNVSLQRDFDPKAGMIEVFPQEITRVLLNLISNGFYAVTKRKTDNGGGDFEPLVTASTKGSSSHVEIRIRDNGIGILPEVKEKMFNPFFTTKPAGEGTGLGLSMSHDIIVKQHGGTIDVDTEPGVFTEFMIVLPRTKK